MVSGTISGMGIGGGAVLIPALVFIFGMEQHTAQNINLIYFIPTAAVALISHIKQGNIQKKSILSITLFGLIGAAAGAYFAVNMNADVLRKIFGGFLLLMGAYEFFRKEQKDKKISNEAG
jgi:uncharacterized membrane protein YfcA